MDVGAFYCEDNVRWRRKIFIYCTVEPLETNTFVLVSLLLGSHLIWGEACQHRSSLIKRAADLIYRKFTEVISSILRVGRATDGHWRCWEGFYAS